MQDIHLSPHFELREFTESATARRHGIENEPPAEAVENLKALCVNTLEPLRKALGMPLFITSGYRCKALNDRVSNHSTRSQHMNGQAADFCVGHAESEGTSGFSYRDRLVKAFRTIILDEGIDYDQLIIYPTFIHVSYVRNGKNRKRLTKAYGNGKYCALTRADALTLL